MSGNTSPYRLTRRPVVFVEAARQPFGEQGIAGRPAEHDCAGVRESQRYLRELAAVGLKGALIEIDDPRATGLRGFQDEVLPLPLALINTTERRIAMVRAAKSTSPHRKPTTSPRRIPVTASSNHTG